jgi:sugar phosphate isomerase/epimerase
VCDEAARFDLRIAFEFMRWRSVRTIEEAARLVAEADRPNGGIVLDALHLSRSGGSPEAVAKVPAHRLMYLQLCDARATQPLDDEAVIAEARGGRLDPGRGTLWLNELMDVLPDNIEISVEVPGAIPVDASVQERSTRAAQGLDRWLARYRARAA